MNFGTITSSKFYERELVRHLCHGNNFLSLIFSKILKDNEIDIESLIKNMINSRPPPIYKVTRVNKDVSYYYYCLHDIESFYNPNTPKIDYTSFYFSKFALIGKTWSKQLYPFLTSSYDVPEMKTQLILTCLQKFTRQFSGLYLALKPQVSSVLARIGPQKYISFLQFGIFELLLNIDPSIVVMFPPGMINYSNIAKFWQYPAVLTNNKFAELFQNLTAASEQFPSDSKLYRRSGLFTLTNTSITKKKFFIDLVFSLAHNTLMSRDFNAVMNIIQVLPDFKPWILLADFEKVYPDIQFFNSLLDIYKTDDTPLNIFNRFKNDEFLFTFMQQLTGVNYESGVFESISLPKILSDSIIQDQLSDINTLRKLSTSDFYIISDDARKKDFFFIFSYLAASLIIKNLNNTSITDENTIIENLELILNSIEVNSKLLIDLFSLIFICERDFDDNGFVSENQNNNFICKLRNAEQILSILVQYAQDIKNEDTKYILSGFHKVHQLIALGSQNTLQTNQNKSNSIEAIENNRKTFTDLFSSSFETVFDALDNHEFEMAKRLASNDSSLLLIVEVSQIIFDLNKSINNNTFLQGNDVPGFANIANYDEKFKADIFLSSNLTKKVLQNSGKFDFYFNDDDVKTIDKTIYSLIIKRLDYDDNELDFLSVIESSGFFTNILNMFDESISFHTAFETDNNRFPLMRQFLKHLDSCSKIIAIETESIIDSIIMSNKAQTWSDIEQVLGVNALEKIVSEADLTKISSNIMKIISNEYPIIGSFIKLFADFKNHKLSKTQKINFENLLFEIKENKTVYDLIKTGKTNEKDAKLALLQNLLHDLNHLDNSNKIIFIKTLFELTIHSCNDVNSLLFSLLDISYNLFETVIPVDILIFFAKSILKIRPFPLEFALELKMNSICLIYFDEHISEFTSSLNLIELSELFPEKVNQDVSDLIKMGITSPDPNQIILQLIERNKISFAYNYSKSFNLSSFFFDNLIDKISRELTTDSFLITEKLTNTNFMNYYRKIYDILKYDISLANTIYERLPSHFKTQTNEQIFNLISNNFDFDDAKSNIKQSSEETSGFINRLNNCQSINEINLLIKADIQKAQLFEDKIRLRLLYLINKITIRNSYDEIKAIKSLLTGYHIQKAISHLHTSRYNEFKFFLDFVHQEFCLRFGIQYSLNDKDFILKKCVEFDELWLVRKAKEVWPFLDISPFLFTFAKNTLLLNQKEDFNNILEIQKTSNRMDDVENNAKNTVKNNINYSISELINTISRPSIFELSYNPNIIHVEIIPPYYRIKMIIQGNTALINSELFKMTDEAILAFGTEEKLIRFHNRIGKFSINDKIISNINEFIKYAIKPILGNGNWNGMFRFLFKDYNKNEKIKKAATQFEEFLKKNSLHYSLYDIGKRLNHKEDSIIAITEFFSELNSWKEQKRYISDLVKLTESELNERKNGKRAEKISLRVLNDLYTKSKITVEFCQLCITNNMNFDKTLDLFSSNKSDKSIELMSLFSFIKSNFILGIQIASMKPEKMDSIINNSVDIVFRGEENDVNTYMNELRKQLTGDQYLKFAIAAVNCFTRKVKENKSLSLSKFIIGSIKGNALKVKLLVQNGFLQDALSICKDKANIPLILDAAKRINDKKIIRECNKLLL